MNTEIAEALTSEAVVYRRGEEVRRFPVDRQRFGWHEMETLLIAEGADGVVVEDHWTPVEARDVPDD